MHMTKRLYRSKENKILAGILGGVGEYFDTDPVLVRLIYLIILIATGVVPGVVVYILAIFVVPERPVVTVVHDESHV